MGKPSTAAQNRYIAKAYDRVNLTLPKGRKDEVKAHAEQRGESLNGFIQRAINETMQRDDASSGEGGDNT
ncbi:MAG: hypothetical protein Q4P20_06315 [Eubacteriales bacterium]|nr:hypothetical protein [Eubacteriales bacterium]